MLFEVVIQELVDFWALQARFLIRKLNLSQNLDDLLRVMRLESLREFLVEKPTLDG